MSCFEGWKIGKEWENPWKIHTSKGWWRKSYDGRVMFPVSSQPRIPAKPWKQGRSWKCTDPVAIHLVRTSSLNTRIHGYWWNTTSQPPSETLPNTKREISQQWWCKVWLYAMTFCMCVCAWIYISLYHAAIFLPRSFSGPGTSGWYANIYPGQPEKRHLSFQWSLSLPSGVYNVVSTELSSWRQKISLGIAKMACRDSIWFFENHLLSYAIIICRRKHRVSSHWTWLVYLLKQPDASMPIRILDTFLRRASEVEVRTLSPIGSTCRLGSEILLRFVEFVVSSVGQYYNYSSCCNESRPQTMHLQHL